MIAARLVEQLTQRGWSVAAAESCTGGMIASALTEVPGSSAVFRYGVVTYANEAKTRLLGVPPEVFIADGAVSESCARAMLIGLRELAQAELCCAVTGIAGPGGGSAEKPVGTVWVGLGALERSWLKRHHFEGGRAQVRTQARQVVLRGMSRILEGSSPWEVVSHGSRSRTNGATGCAPPSWTLALR